MCCSGVKSLYTYFFHSIQFTVLHAHRENCNHLIRLSSSDFFFPPSSSDRMSFRSSKRSRQRKSSASILAMFSFTTVVWGGLLERREALSVSMSNRSRAGHLYIYTCSSSSVNNNNDDMSCAKASLTSYTVPSEDSSSSRESSLMITNQ